MTAMHQEDGKLARWLRLELREATGEGSRRTLKANVYRNNSDYVLTQLATGPFPLNYYQPMYIGKIQLQPQQALEVVVSTVGDEVEVGGKKGAHRMRYSITKSNVIYYMKFGGRGY